MPQPGNLHLVNCDQDQDPEPDKRINVGINPDIYRRLNKLAKRRGKSLSAAVRDSILLTLLIEEPLYAGDTVTIEFSNSKRITLLLR